MRIAVFALLLASQALAAGRVYDRACDVASRRSSRGGVHCSTTAAVPSPLLTGIEAYWPLTTDSVDVVAGVHTGTDSPGLTYTDSAVVFTGSAARITFPAVTVASAFSYAAWIKPTAVNGSYQTIIALNSSNGWYVKSGALDYYTSGDHAGLITMPSGAWSFVACTYDGTTLIQYVNGVADATSTPAKFSPIFLGNDAAGGSDPFIGSMKLAGAWLRVLTPAEVATLAAGAVYPF